MSTQHMTLTGESVEALGAAVGSPFCNTCLFLCDVNTANPHMFFCYQCGTEQNPGEAIFKSREQERVIQEPEKEAERTTNDATISVNCPVCSHNLASFRAVQLRSVDEGQTIFYSCMSCSHKWSQDT